MAEHWLKPGDSLPTGDTVRELYVSGHNWQLYSTHQGSQALAVSAALHEAWLSREWLEPGLFEEISGAFVWAALQGSMISSMEFGPYPTRPAQARQMVRTLLRSRERIGAGCFGDALYLSQFSLLLPTLGTAAAAEHARVVGRWLTGGMNVSVSDVDRVRRYAPWLSQSALEEILADLGMTGDYGGTAALEAPAKPSREIVESGLGSRRRPDGPFRLPGRPQLETFFREEIIEIIDHEEEYRRMGTPFPGAALLYGPPGSGKTYAVEKLAAYLNWPLYTVSSASVGSRYIHETGRRIGELFQQAADNAPALVVMDELESFLSTREGPHAGAEAHLEEVGELLRCIAGAAEKRVLVFGMTNMPDAIDKAALRRGRFDHMLEVGMPSRQEVRAALEALLDPLPKAANLPLDDVAAKLAGRPLSDAGYVVRQAGRLAVRQKLDRIDANCLREAVQSLPAAGAGRKKLGFE